MDLYELVPTVELDNMYEYLKSYGNCGFSRDNLRVYLREWEKAKKDLYKAFGNNFIISKRIKYTQSVDELWNQMSRSLDKVNEKTNIRGSEFLRRLDLHVKRITDSMWAEQCLYDLVNYETLIQNTYTGHDFTIPAEHLKSGKSLTIQKGCKVAKVLCKLGKELEIPDEIIEQFRLAHSLALNQKQVEGELCLSIHPFDYITMSDNKVGWGSCMSWTGEECGGDYRIGTVEMMNSSNAIVAYIRGEEDADWWNCSWNNKKWRQLILVTPDLILGNRQYPYENDFIQGEAVLWVRELMGVIPGYGPYSETAINLENNRFNTIGNETVSFCLHFTNMYNDIYDKRLAYLSNNFLDACVLLEKPDERYYTYTYNFSGAAICLECLDIISDWRDPSEVMCSSCSGYEYCTHCGCEVYREDLHWVGDYPYCSYCYENELEVCGNCEEIYDPSDLVNVYFKINNIETDFNLKHKIRLCYHCIDRGELCGAKIETATIQQYEPAIKVKAVDILAMDWEKYAFDPCETVDDMTYLIIERLRNAETDEDRIKILQETGYSINEEKDSA